MSKKFLNRFTKHLVYAASKADEKGKAKKPLIRREIPKLPLTPIELPTLPRLEPTMTSKEVDAVVEERLEKEIPTTPTVEQVNRPAKPSTETLKSPLEMRIEQTEKDLNDFGKLNEFIKDPSVKIIECEGPNKEIKVKKADAVTPTGVKLTELEISDIVRKFQTQEGTPLTETFRSKLGNLSITAFISPIAGTKFMIVKE